VPPLKLAVHRALLVDIVHLALHDGGERVQRLSRHRVQALGKLQPRLVDVRGRPVCRCGCECEWGG
jgi:hypothetical protein